jgi:hypothetical protein
LIASPALTPSELAAQNDLFHAAMRVEERGRTADAIKLLNRYIRKYPDGPNIEDALARRMRLLAATDPWAGSQAAGDYLTRFPGGAYRGEARRLSAGRP